MLDGGLIIKGKACLHLDVAHAGAKGSGGRAHLLASS
jgi:hypothetical protein